MHYGGSREACRNSAEPYMTLKPSGREIPDNKSLILFQGCQENGQGFYFSVYFFFLFPTFFFILFPPFLFFSVYGNLRGSPWAPSKTTLGEPPFRFLPRKRDLADSKTCIGGQPQDFQF